MSTKRSHNLAARSDKELLMSGQFSDVTVKCGDKSWNLHRNILSARCEYFREALEVETSKKSPKPSMVIEDVDPVHVNWIIYFIYTEKASNDLLALLENDDTMMQTMVELFTIAEFFLLDELCTCAREILKMKLLNSTHKTRRSPYNYSIEVYHEMKDETFITRFADTVRAAYNNGSGSFRRLKEALIIYANISGNIVFQEESMGNSFFSDPGLSQFALDVFKYLVNKKPRSSQDLCEQCRDKRYDPHRVPKRMEGLCQYCIPTIGEEAMESLREAKAESLEETGETPRKKIKCEDG
ncbi:BTB/POZ protein [Xylaria sp. FL0933]|nr:BTB/POZ protein [Xylaria sp. FL0933]